MTAWNELAQAVAEAKRDAGALHPVTVIVPNNGSSLDVTRFLARELGSDKPLLNVHATTIDALALALFQTTGLSAGRMAATPALRQAAARASLLGSPGVFGRLAKSYATAAAIARTSAVLDFVDAGLLDVPARDTLTTEVLAVHEHIRSTLAPHCYFGDEVFAGAESTLADPARVASLGTVILFCVDDPRSESDGGPVDAAHKLLNALAHATGAQRIVAPDVRRDSVGPVIATARLIRATDSDEECRAIARLIAEDVRGTATTPGMPGHRIGVFLPSSIPYRTALSQHLTQAGIEHSVTAPIQLVDSSPARHLVRLMRAVNDLALDITPDAAREPAPDPLLDPMLIADAMSDRALFPPIKQFPTATRVERLVRQPAETEEPDGAPDTSRLTDHERRAMRDRELFDAYRADLTTRLGAALSASTWKTATDSIRAIVDNDFTPGSGAVRFAGLDDDNEFVEYREALLSAVDALTALDLSPLTPTPTDVIAQLTHSIESGYLKHGKSGRGVTITSLANARGRDFDKTYILGLAEGIAPPRVFEDPLFRDDYIGQSESGLATRTERAKRLEDDFRHAVVTGSREGSAGCVLSFPHGNLRGGDSRVLSRWVASHLNLAEGDDIDTLPNATIVGSFYDSQITGAPLDTTNGSAGIPATRQSWLMSTIAGNPAYFAQLDPATDLARAARMRKDRRLGLFSDVNGNLAGHREELTELLRRDLSATHVEQYRDAPLSFFLQRVLGAHPLNDLTLTPEIDPLTRGVLIHEVLELWVKAGIAGTHPWDEDSLRAICAETCDRYRAEVGTYWVEQYWQRDKQHIDVDVRLWHRVHTAMLAEGWSPTEAERSFGKSGAADEWDSVEIAVDNELGSIRFQGQIDRLDSGPATDGAQAIRVIDYKSGNAKPFKSISTENPTADGYKYQLAVYGKLARDRAVADAGSASVPPVEGTYWFVPRDASIKQLDPDTTLKLGPYFTSLTLTDEVLDIVRANLTSLTNDIMNGAFPPKPSSSYDDRYTKAMNRDALTQLWTRVAESPALLNVTTFWVGADIGPDDDDDGFGPAGGTGADGGNGADGENRDEATDGE